MLWHPDDLSGALEKTQNIKHRGAEEEEKGERVKRWRRRKKTFKPFSIGYKQIGRSGTEARRS